MKNSHISITVVTTLLLMLALPQPADARRVLEPRGEDEPGSSVSTDSNEDIRELVADRFGAGHVMVDVARCESSFRQFESDGDVLVNTIGAVGVFQILERVHEDVAEDLGFDIDDPEDNVAYAERLYEADGLKPWSASSLCWDDGNVEEANPELSEEKEERAGKLRRRLHGAEAEEEKEVDEEREYEQVITRRLIIGVETTQVRRLQELLNELGYELAESGPGSPGQETSFFGTLTKRALQEFQCDQEIVCSGAEYTTGYGMTDGPTRAALNEAAAEGTMSNRVQRRDDSDEDQSDTADLQDQINRLTQMIADLRAQPN